MKPEPLLTNERAEREWKYLCQRVGEERAVAAISQLKGSQRPYPLNIARVLKIQLPEEAQLPRSDAQERARQAGQDQAACTLADLKRMLR